MEIALGPGLRKRQRGHPDAPCGRRPGRERHPAPPGQAQAAQDPQNAPGGHTPPQAIEWQALLESGEASSQAAIARREGISRARVTQVMGLLRLAPEIQERVLSLPDLVRRPAITERALRPMAMRKSTVSDALDML